MSQNGRNQKGEISGTALIVLLVISILVNIFLITAVGLLVRSLRKNKDGTVKSPLMVLRRAVSRKEKVEADPTTVKIDPDEDKPIIKNQTKSNDSGDVQSNAWKSSRVNSFHIEINHFKKSMKNTDLQYRQQFFA